VCPVDPVAPVAPVCPVDPVAPAVLKLFGNNGFEYDIYINEIILLNWIYI
jgi:hypothetical protein